MKHLMIVGAILCGLPLAFASALAQTWTASRAPSTNWVAVASSADGTKLVAAAGGAGTNGPIFVSADSGITWAQSSAPIRNWVAIASCAYGSELVAAENGGAVYRSTNSGANWQVTDSPNAAWQAIANSGDGAKLVAVYASGLLQGGIYISTNSGTTWSSTAAPTNGWYSVAGSADGTKLAAMMVDSLTPAGPYGWVFLSTNGGAMWTQTERVRWPTALAASADGMQLVAAQGENGPLPGSILISSNAGATWSSASAPSAAWSSAASSADGTHQVAAIGGLFGGPISGSIYVSTDSGATWSATDAPTNNWAFVASSADGCRLVAAVNGGGIYTWQTAPTPALNITAAGNGLVISWVIPSMNFVLQQNPGLNRTNWTNVATPPVLNPTNLQNQVTLTLPSAPTFYRLKSLSP